MTETISNKSWLEVLHPEGAGAVARVYLAEALAVALATYVLHRVKQWHWAAGGTLSGLGVVTVQAVTGEVVRVRAAEAAEVALDEERQGGAQTRVAFEERQGTLEGQVRQLGDEKAALEQGLVTEQEEFNRRIGEARAIAEAEKTVAVAAVSRMAQFRLDQAQTAYLQELAEVREESQRELDNARRSQRERDLEVVSRIERDALERGAIRARQVQEATEPLLQELRNKNATLEAYVNELKGLTRWHAKTVAEELADHVQHTLGRIEAARERGKEEGARQAREEMAEAAQRVMEEKPEFDAKVGAGDGAQTEVGRLLRETQEENRQLKAQMAAQMEQMKLILANLQEAEKDSLVTAEYLKKVQNK